MSDRDLFLTALDKPDPAAHAAANADSPEQRERVASLLAAHAAAGGFLEQPAADPGRTGPHTPSVADPDRTGPLAPPTATYYPEAATTGPAEAGLLAGRYRLGEPLGEGGMGSVYRAEQLYPVKRPVAIKLIRAGMDSARVVARFEGERQALAVMDHPHIAKVLDAGTTPDGRPFFAMELVEGLPLTAYCDARRLTVPDRLRLFAQVCQAVQHAHQKGVIHRDLKPGNILVTEADGKPVPKVIDFGLAKALDAGLLPDVSVDGSVLGTPLYMAPEQADATADVDTRADVYALGVILYELLTGSTPLTRESFRKAALAEMLRMVREVDPPTPVKRLDTAEALPSIAAVRGIEPGRLKKLVRGDLEWVTMKCLEKDRGRRYETANAVAAEVQRYLADEPVAAGPPSRWYRGRKFVRRNRGPVLAAGLVLAALVAGVVGTSVGLVRADRARAAEAERAEGERVAKEDANTQRETAENRKRLAETNAQRAVAVRDFLLRDLLGQADSEAQAEAVRKLGEGEGFANNPRIKELLDRAARQLTPERIDAKFPDQPEVQAEILASVGNTYRAVGEFDKAIAFLNRAVTTWTAARGADYHDTLAVQSVLALTLHEAGRLPEAIKLFEQVRDIQVKTVGHDDPDTLINLDNLAGAYLDAGRRDEAVALLKQVRDIQVKRLGADHVDTLTTSSNLARAYNDTGDLPAAIDEYERVRASSERALGLDHPLTISVRNGLANAYRDFGQLPKAIDLYERIWADDTRTRGADHPNTLVAAHNVASAYAATRTRFPEAIKLFEETRAAQVKKVGADHPHTLATERGLAAAYIFTERNAEAIDLLERVRDAEVKAFGADHPRVLNTLNDLALAYQGAGRLAEAIGLLERVTEAKVQSLGADHQETLVSLTNWGVAEYQAGRVGDAVRRLRRAAEGVERLDFRHGYAEIILDSLALCLERSQAYPEAEVWRRKWLAVLKGQKATATPGYEVTLERLGGNLSIQGKWAEAESVFRECLALRTASIPGTVLTADTRSRLGESLFGQQKYADAEPLLLAGYEGLKQGAGKRQSQALVRLTQDAAYRLIRLYDATGRPADAAKWRTERGKYGPEVAPPPRPAR